MLDLLIVFAKAPVAGRVKTRLTPSLTAEEAARVYEASLSDVVQRAEQTGAEILLSYDPREGSAEYFARRFPRFRQVAQQGADLGERLSRAAEDAFASGAEHVCIIGGDSPTLPPAYLLQSFDDLREADAVFGPTEDGGYYLVGIRKAAWPAAAQLFDRIPWSSPEVLEASLEAGRRAGLVVHLAGKWFDIDRPEDLLTAAEQATPDSHLAALLMASPAILQRIAPA